MKLTLGFSPCPNDTFIFDALVNGKIDTEDLSFEILLEDVQTLNEWAKAGRLDISKISYGVLPVVTNEYIVLEAGGALGKGVGPLLIASHQINTSEVDNAVIAIPGMNTTAHMLFSLAFPHAMQKQFLRFDAIENFVLDNAGASIPHLGVIIHENRFTYAQKGLFKLMDLGGYWETKTGLPIPLGGIVMKRTFDKALQQRVNQMIRKSLEYAFANQTELPSYVRQHSQEMEEAVMRQHIDLYVNDYSLDLGTEGKQAVYNFLDIYANLNNQQEKAEQLRGDSLSTLSSDSAANTSIFLS